MDKKPVLIIENCTSGLEKINEELNSKKEKQYILSGTFTEFNVRNRNDRVYTAAKFLPHLTELLERKTLLKKIYGEYDHPDVFDTSLKRISHTIETLEYVKEQNLVRGSIKLLNTQWGKEAKALIDDDCPIFVSSRAAGITESNGEVTIKKLFTYDAVADPGFASARMALNESLGFNENVNFRIYEMTDESKINQLFDMNNNDVVTKTQMEEYSNYLTKEMSSIKEELNTALKAGNVSPEKIESLHEYYSNLNESFNKVSSYLDYLAENLQILVNENKTLKDTTDNLIKHNDYLAENLNKSIKYSDYLAEKLDKTIDYGEYIGETLSNNIDFSEYIAEHVDKNINYSNYIAEQIDKTIIYSEYLAESIDKNIDYSEYLAESIDNTIVYSEYLAEHVDSNIAYSEYIAENLDNSIKYGEYIAEHVDNSIAYSEYIAENLSDTQAYTNYIAEGLDKSIDYQKYIAQSIKGSKVNENLETPEERIGDLKVNNVEIYYEEDESQPDNAGSIEVQDDDKIETTENGIQGEDNTATDAIAPTPTDGEVQIQENPDIQATTQPTQPITQPTEATQPASISIVPGMKVELDDNTTGEVIATNPQNGIVVVQTTIIPETGAEGVDAQPQTQVQEIQESRIIRVIGDKLIETTDSILENIKTLIAESKKRKASEEQEPNFVLFLSESNKANWLKLSIEDKEKVIVAVNESKYSSEAEVINIIQKALTANQKTFEQVIIEKIPEDLKQVWESLDTKIQNSIVAQSKLYNLNTPERIESFWTSRGLTEMNEQNKRKLITESAKFLDNSKLSDEEADKYISVLKNLK